MTPQIYKKLVVEPRWNPMLGGILIGGAEEYARGDADACRTN